MSPDLVVDPTAVPEIRENGSAAMLVVADCTDRNAALAALSLAHDDIWQIPDPDEADRLVASFVSVDDTDDGPRIRMDLKDEGPLVGEQIVGIVASRLREAGVGGVLRGVHDDEDDDDTDDDGPSAREWALEAPPVLWPSDLPVLPGTDEQVVLAFRRHGEQWLYTMREGVEPTEADALVADFTATGWSVTSAADPADPDLVGPFSDFGAAPGLRIWRAERDGRAVVLAWTSAPDGSSVHATTPVGDIPAAVRSQRRTPPAPDSGWPDGFPADLPTVSDLAAPLAATVAPGVEGQEWRQTQAFRRRPGHATDFVEALTATGWRLEDDDERALAAMEAASAGRGGLEGAGDVRGWTARRGDEFLFIISVPIPGAGALLVVSTPAG